MLSAYWLIGAYFLAVSSHKCGRLNTSVYGISKGSIPKFRVATSSQEITTFTLFMSSSSSILKLFISS